MGTASILLPILRPILPYLPSLPTPVLTLLPSLALHLGTHPSPSPLSFFTAPTTHPLHLPLCFLLFSIPFIYTLGLLTGNVSWVDRLWPFYTPLCTLFVPLYIALNDRGNIFAHNAPRILLMFGLQIIWSARLLSHALKRGFYDFTGEDYRYTAFRKIAPKWAFGLVHLFAVAIAQPILIFALSLPTQAVLTLPPSELSPGWSNLHIPFSTITPFLPKSYHSASPHTPVLNLSDLFLTALSLTILYVEYKADRQMYAFQEAKHGVPKNTPLIHPPFSRHGSGSAIKGAPRPAAYPEAYHPGFPTEGMYKWSRHPNFAAEQLFWFTQALFVVGAGESSGVTRSGWMGASVFGPPFAVRASRLLPLLTVGQYLTA